MSKKTIFQPFVILSALLVLVIALLGIHPATPTRAAAVKIMALGDSITGSPGCWRAILWNKLIANGITNFQPVGTLPPAGCANDIANDYHEGHGGFLATGIANANQLPGWLSASNPDIVIMHLGTNDSFSASNTVDMILAAYTTLVGQMRANNPNMKILVAQIIPLYTATGQCPVCYQDVVNLNAAIPGWAAGLTTAQSPIIVVDQWTGFDTTTDTGDGIHPNDLGIQKIADKWYPAISSILAGIPIPTNTTGPTPTITLTPTITKTIDPSTVLQVQMHGNGSDNTQQTTFSFTIKNSGSIPVSNLEARIYYTTDGTNAGSGYTLEKYYDGSNAATVGAPVLVSGNSYYIPVSYGTASLAAGGTWEYQGGLHLTSWGSTFDGSNDWFHTGYALGALPTAYTTTNYIPVFVGGALAIGSTPGGSTATNTPVVTATRTSTSAPSNTPTLTSVASPTRTTTATNTSVVTLTPTRTNTTGPTATRTNTPAVTNTPSRTSTTGPTPTRTMTPTVTATSGSGTCTPTSTITAPFTFDGAGTFCWQSSNLGSYVNSWNTTSVSINGVNESNLYVAAASYPAKIGGFWYVSYSSAVSYGHFEAK